MSIDYGKTLNLPKTEFPMRGNLPVREPEVEARWEEMDIYKQVLERTKDRPSFILHDGPPYANGDIHIGHSLNKTLKDIIVRYKSMAGFYAPYVPGWDTHGLPIEQAIVNAQKLDRRNIEVNDFRKRCEEYAWSYVEKQRDQFKRLGIRGDWENPYVTLLPEYEAAQIRVFGAMATKGYIYKGLRCVYWSPSSETALADAEIEYYDKRSASIYVRFMVGDGKGKLDQDTGVIIWTTTPWTLPANKAISLNPDLEYSVVVADGNKYLVASGLVESVTKEIGWEQVEAVQTFKGSDLEGIETHHPFYERISPVILGDHVTLDAGTGCVHTAPGHGEDDFNVAKKYNIEVLCPVDHEGKLTKEAPGFEGLFYEDANKVVSEKLKENGALLKLSFITHSYPHDWRTKKPIIFRATEQWFASVEGFRSQMLQAIKDVKWTPHWGETRLANMVADRNDWCISRQRVWGVPIPIFYCKTCNEPIINEQTIDHIANLFAKEGSGVWFAREASELIPAGLTCKCGCKEFRKETDIMDVWFDSGSSHEAVLRQRDNLSWPADLYLEGSDQYRGWFNSSITTSVAINGVAPYKSIISQGMVLDGEGRKMSKSLGNTILPEKVINQMGADILRLWVSSVDAEADVRVSMDILNQVSEVYRKIRNTMRFLLANTSDFNPAEHTVAYADLRSVDKYMTVRLNQVIQEIRENGYEKYNFMHIYRTVMNFLTVDLSSFYLDFAKDVVYIEAENDYQRRCMQTVFYQTLVSLTKLLTPIIPHTAEEIWSFLQEEEEYVQLAEFPGYETFTNEEELMDTWAAFMDFRDNVLKALEEARHSKLIGKSLEAKVTVYPNEQIRQLMTAVDADISQLLIVSDFEVSKEVAPSEAVQFEDMAILVEKAEGETCDRCRSVRQDVGSDEKLPTLCGRCAHIVEENYPEAVAEGFE